jgi:phosphoglycolate phosphatase
MKHAVIFDFDGTIGDSFEYVYDFLKREARNETAYSKAELQALRGMSMRRLALHLGVPVWRLVPTYFKGRRVMRAHMEHVHIFPGMDHAIRQLHQDGAELFIVSANSTHNIRSFLKHYGLSHYFTAVRGGTGFMGKRSVIKQLMLRHHLQHEGTWYVGDETADVVAATAAGIPCLAVTWGFADPKKMALLEPAATAEQAQDIPTILEKKWKK